MVLLPPRREPFERRATGSVLQFINTVSHRERRCAAPARRATEAYSKQYGARSATKLERMQRRSNATVFVNRSTKASLPRVEVAGDQCLAGGRVDQRRLTFRLDPRHEGRNRGVHLPQERLGVDADPEDEHEEGEH